MRQRRNKYANPERGFILLGLTFTRTGDYFNYKDYSYFQFPYEVLNSIEGVKNIMHSPEFKGNPSNVGSPNNKSHSLVYSDIDDLGVRVNLADYPRNNYEDSKCVIDQSAIDKDLEELRQRLNDTEYHKLWNFAN